MRARVAVPALAMIAAGAGACAGAREAPAGGRCAGRQPGDLVVTEMLVDPAGADTGKEYVEIFNASGDDVDLAGMVLYAAAPDEKKVTLGAATVPAGAYFVLAGAHASDPVPAYVGLSFDSGLGSLRNAAGTIGLRCGGTQLDEVAYTATRAGHARELDGALAPDFTVNDDGARWCDAVEPIAGTDDFGTPGARNSPCPAAPGGGGGAGGSALSCTDSDTGAARASVAPGPGDLVITEIMAHPGVAPEMTGEWLEIYAVRDLDLNGLTVRTASGAATLAAPACLRVAAGAYALLARSDDPAANGGLPAVAAKLTIALADGAGTVAITNGDVLIDGASWASSTKGVAAQLDPGKTSAAANDDPAAFCPATDFFAGGGGDKGTPGAPNTACLAPGSDERTGGDGTCVDPDGGQPRDVVRPGAGDLVITEVMPDPAAASDAAGEWFEVIATAAAAVDLNGLELANEGSGSTVVTAPACLTLAPGDRAVFARSDDPAANGGLPPVAARFTFALANTGTAAAPRAVVLRSGGREVDRMTYAASKPGVSWQSPPIAPALPRTTTSPHGASPQAPPPPRSAPATTAPRAPPTDPAHDARAAHSDARVRRRGGRPARRRVRRRRRRHRPGRRRLRPGARARRARRRRRHHRARGRREVRYLLVDTPESTTTVECYGEEAAAANRALVDARTVDLTYDHPCTDRYGRLLAYVRAGDIDVNAYLVDHGFACVLHIPPAGDDRAADFTALESTARLAGRGLWSNCASNPPRCTTR